MFLLLGLNFKEANVDKIFIQTQIHKNEKIPSVHNLLEKILAAVDKNIQKTIKDNLNAYLLKNKLIKSQ